MAICHCICRCLLQQILLPSHYLLLLVNHSLLCLQLVPVFGLLYLQCFFCNNLPLSIRWRTAPIILSSFLDVSGLSGQDLLLLVEHGRGLVGLGQHVVEGRAFLAHLGVLEDSVLPLEVVEQGIAIWRGCVLLLGGVVEGRLAMLFFWLGIYWLRDQGRGWGMRVLGFGLACRLLKLNCVGFDYCVGILIFFEFYYTFVWWSLDKVLHS